MKKILLIILLFILTGCTVIQYSYYPKPLNNINADYKEYVYISTYLEKSLDEKSLIEHISVYDKRNSGMNKHYVKILSPTVKVIYNNKEYIVSVDRKYRYTISLLEQNIKINDNFTMYIGKVQLDNGKIIDIPPLKFKKHVLIEKYNGLDDAFSKGVPRKEIFSGTVENYKKQKK